MNKIILNKCIINENSIEYDYFVTGDISKYFILSERFIVEYSEDISSTPQSIAVIPFLTNFLPISWVTDSQIIVDEIDKSFYENLGKIKDGYINMYPNIKFSGSLLFNKVVDNNWKDDEKTAMFFSGGLDSYFTLIQNIKYSPKLITIWGADIPFDDITGWKSASKHVKNVSKTFNLDYCFIKSPFRRVVDYLSLNNLVEKKSNSEWWHDFQHGIGIIGHAAPVVYKNKLNMVYIASTYSINDKQVSCASYPTIDNNVRIGSCKVIHDGFEYTRQDKVLKVCKYSITTNKKIHLRVCWEVAGGHNCSACEKCIRTIMGIYAEGYNPVDFGFLPDYEHVKSFVIEKDLFKKNHRYKPILKRYIENKEKFINDPNINWLYEIGLDSDNKTNKSFKDKIIKKCFSKLMGD